MHALAPVKSRIDPGQRYRSTTQIGTCHFRSELSYEPLHGHAYARKLGQSRQALNPLTNRRAKDLLAWG